MTDPLHVMVAESLALSIENVYLLRLTSIVCDGEVTPTIPHTTAKFIRQGDSLDNRAENHLDGFLSSLCT